MKNSLRTLAALAVSCLAFTVSANAANLLINGGFEQGNYNVGAPYTTLGSGSTAITGWVVSGSLDWHIIVGPNAHFGHNGVDGSQYAVDLSSGGQPGIYQISQTFATTVGQTYHLEFLLGAPGFNTGVTVNVGDVSQDFYAAGSSQFGFPWHVETIDFTAVDANTMLSFSGFEGGFWSPVIDNVSVTAAAAASAPDSGATLLLMGLGLTGMFASRRMVRKHAA